MNNSKTATQKHMTLDDRISIEKGLDQHLSLRSIALQLGKDPTTISKEIKSTGLSRNTIVLMNLLTNVLWQKIAKRKIFVVPMPLFAKGCADPAIIATLTARTLFLNLTIAVCWIKPLCLQWLQ